jgi:uncharacterized phage protein (TIGR01671 family)
MEIKFRGKITADNQWAFGSLVISDSPSAAPSARIVQWIPGMPYFWKDVQYATLGQFAGIKDNKGREVYAGDIVKYDHEYGSIVAVVCYRQHDDESVNISGFYYKFLYRVDYEYDDQAVEFEIIGNIHDTPHLLKDPEQNG